MQKTDTDFCDMLSNKTPSAPTAELTYERLVREGLQTYKRRRTCLLTQRYRDTYKDGAKASHASAPQTIVNTLTPIAGMKHWARGLLCANRTCLAIQEKLGSFQNPHSFTPTTGNPSFSAH